MSIVYICTSYGIIRECLVHENDRPEMTRIRAYLCHSNMLSKRAFQVPYSLNNPWRHLRFCSLQYYRSEYNRYQEENAIDGNVERLAEDQGVRDLPTFDNDYGTYEDMDRYANVMPHPTVDSNLYYAEPEEGDTDAQPLTVPPVPATRGAPIKPPRNATGRGDSYL